MPHVPSFTRIGIIAAMTVQRVKERYQQKLWQLCTESSDKRIRTYWNEKEHIIESVDDSQGTYAITKLDTNHYILRTEVFFSKNQEVCNETQQYVAHQAFASAARNTLTASKTSKKK